MKLTCYRYQLIVDKSNLFIEDQKVNSYGNADGIEENKKSIFINTLDKIIKNASIENKEFRALMVNKELYNDLLILRVGQVRDVRISDDIIGESTSVQSWHNTINIFIDTNPSSQVIAIEEDKIKKGDISKLLIDPLKDELKKFFICFKCMPLSKDTDFWSFIQENNLHITKLEATVYAPNMSSSDNKVQSFLETVRAGSNANTSKLTLKSKTGYLNLSKENQTINSIAKLATRGLCSVVMEAKKDGQNNKNKYDSTKPSQPIQISASDDIDKKINNLNDKFKMDDISNELDDIILKLRQYLNK